jgi:hypothetical protein
MDRRLEGPQSRSGCCEEQNNLVHGKNRTPEFQPVVRRYTELSRFRNHKSYGYQGRLSGCVVTLLRITDRPCGKRICQIRAVLQKQQNGRMERSCLQEALASPLDRNPSLYRLSYSDFIIKKENQYNIINKSTFGSKYANVPINNISS